MTLHMLNNATDNQKEPTMSKRSELIELIASCFDEIIGKGAATELASDAVDEILALGYRK